MLPVEMRGIAASLAAVLAALAVTGCGDDGAEPGAPDGATLVLDFTPNAVHTGLFAAQERDYFEEAGRSWRSRNRHPPPMA